MRSGATTVTLATACAEAPVDGIENVVVCGFGWSAALVVAGRAYGAIGDANGIDEFAVAAGVTDADGPGLVIRIATAQIEIAAGIDGEVLENGELARSEIHGEAFGNGAEVEG